MLALENHYFATANAIIYTMHRIWMNAKIKWNTMKKTGYSGGLTVSCPHYSLITKGEK